MAHHPRNLASLVVFAVVVWRVAVRLRRSFGRQPLKPTRTIVRLCLYSALTIFLTVITLALVPTITVFLGLAGGLAAGAMLGVYGLFLAKFESTPEGRFYTPNPYMGLGLTVLLTGRVIYRYVVLSGVADGARPENQFMQSPLTLLLFGLLAGYYIAFFSGLLIKDHQMQLARTARK